MSKPTLATTSREAIENSADRISALHGTIIRTSEGQATLTICGPPKLGTALMSFLLFCHTSRKASASRHQTITCELKMLRSDTIQALFGQMEDH